jgi:DNA-binding beta-propeller fold protein YncE
VLVSNFNAVSNLQGTGTTIVEISPTGSRRVFAHIDPSKLPGRCPGGVGLTTALSVLPLGFVVVGSLPTTDGTSATAGAGCLIVLDREGRVVETIAGGQINGPWDMTAVPTQDGADLFVTNVLNGTVAANGAVVNRGTVVRVELRIDHGDAPEEMARTVIGSGFAERADSAALVIGPTGLGLASDGTLYVADSLNNRIAAIPDALHRRGTAFAGRDVSANGALNDPLGLTIAPNGHILTVNGADGNIVETTPNGAQVAVKQLDGSGSPPGAGALFGIAIAPKGVGVYFVDDAANTLDLLR